MININLLPEELRKKEPRLKRIDLSSFSLDKMPLANIAVAAIGAVIALHIILFLIGVGCRIGLGAYSRQYQQILPEKQEANALKAQSGEINMKVGAIDGLMVKRFSWAKKLSELSDSVTPGIWLDQLEYDERLGEKPVAAAARAATKNNRSASSAITKKIFLRYLIISGYASKMGEEGTALVGKFIKSLKDNPDFYATFSGIELGTIKSERLESQEVMHFRITCLFRESE